jgi:rod shape-determining protein MreB
VNLFTSVMGLWSADVGIDLGTANTLVHVRGRGIVLDEPSVVAVSRRTGQVLAVGTEARRMLGRTPADIIAMRPLRHGVIADFDTTERMLQYFITTVRRRRSLVLPSSSSPCRPASLRWRSAPSGTPPSRPGPVKCS